MTIKPTSKPESAAEQQKSHTTKKVIKHSRKFERTQTGCLQCRKKKKKCDGRRPSCVSCTKRGSVCQFPANIRFFTFDKSELHKHPQVKAPAIAKSKSVGSSASDTPQDQETSKNDTPKSRPVEIVFSATATPALEEKSSSEPAETLMDIDHQVPIPESVDPSRSSSILSILSETSFATQLTSTEDEEESEAPLYHVDSIFKDLQPESIPRSTGNVMQTIKNNHYSSESKNEDDMEDALNLANDGESINKILNNISIELITKSIQNLSYMNLEEKLNNYYRTQRLTVQTPVNIINQSCISTDFMLKDDIFVNQHVDVCNGLGFDPAVFEF
ncbi:hypothetical protein WICPIJ_003027 [Wickerhamomyces pijperi]|uniref:Zn(2)-C6 fungal-type domain-containing protein n=1 Tax=Wickerhamomyces pijperi TaxID=599730 RepID=A0A9P8Q7X5_WICPI|nr:hypothetical protein WICPIJ_003027 [Wickerhamomyces pijperi]